MKIIAYKKYIDPSISRTLILPVDADNNFTGIELATLGDGLTYVAIPSTATLPMQPDEIKSSVKTVLLTAAQIAEIKNTSPHVALIRKRVQAKIREQFSLDDELKLARLSIGALQKTYTPSAAELESIAFYQTAIEAIVAWGQTEKAKLGLV